MKQLIAFVAVILLTACASTEPLQRTRVISSKWITIEWKERAICTDEQGRVYTCKVAAK